MGENNVGEQVSKSELMERVDSSSLPIEAKSALRELPEGVHDRTYIISTIRERMMAGAASMSSDRMGMRGGYGMGGGYGSGGYK